MKSELDQIAEAVAQGYPDVDQSCAECGRLFKNYHHFLFCDSKSCPMKDGKGTILEQMSASLEEKSKE